MEYMIPVGNFQWETSHLHLVTIFTEEDYRKDRESFVQVKSSAAK